MWSALRSLIAGFTVLIVFAPLTRATAQVDVLTNRYDGARTGANLRETQLTTTNVNVQRFGKLFSYPVDGAVYAQPLYVSGVTVNGIARNVLYVATMNDKVYAFDADSTSGAPLWTRDFTSPPSFTAVPITDIVPANLNIVGNVGVNTAVSAAGTLKNAYQGVSSEIAQALDRLGIKPRTAGAVSESPGVQLAEGAASRLPLASSVLQPRQRAVVADFGRAVDETAGKLGKAETAEQAGTVVQDLLRAWQRGTFQEEQAAVWEPLSQRLAGTSVNPATFRAALERAAKDPALDSLPATQKAFMNGKINEWLEALKKDVPPGGAMSWEQAMAVKRRIGDVMGTPDLVGSIGTGALKNVYGSLSGDMKTTAAQHGQARLFDEANTVTMNGHAFIDNVASRAIKANNPKQETIAPDAAARAMLGDNRALQQLRERVPEAADALGAYHLRKIMEARPSKQGEGSTPSTETFLTEMRKAQETRPEGTRALFDKPGVPGNIDDLLKVAAQLRRVEENANTSRTAGTLMMGIGSEKILAAFMSGDPVQMAKATAALGGPYAVSKFLSSPSVIAIMKAQRPPPPAVPGAVGGVMVNQMGEDRPQ